MAINGNNYAQFNLQSMISSYMKDLSSAKTPGEAQYIASNIESFVNQYQQGMQKTNGNTAGLKAKGQCESCNNCGNCGKNANQGKKMSVMA